MRMCVRFSGFVLPLLLVTSWGCSRPAAPPPEPPPFDGPSGKLGGKITFNGQPVRFGKIVVVGENKQEATGIIMSNGTYGFPYAPAGKVKLYLALGVPEAAKDAFKKYRDMLDKMTPDEKKKMLEEQKKRGKFRLPSGPWDNMSEKQQEWIASIINIPAKYEKLETANLSTTVEEGGENNFAIELVDPDF
jgi:hypothetical protein